MSYGGAVDYTSEETFSTTERARPAGRSRRATPAEPASTARSRQRCGSPSRNDRTRTPRLGHQRRVHLAHQVEPGRVQQVLGAEAAVEQRRVERPVRGNRLEHDPQSVRGERAVPFRRDAEAGDDPTRAAPRGSSRSRRRTGCSRRGRGSTIDTSPCWKTRLAPSATSLAATACSSAISQRTSASCCHRSRAAARCVTLSSQCTGASAAGTDAIRPRSRASPVSAPAPGAAGSDADPTPDGDARVREVDQVGHQRTGVARQSRPADVDSTARHLAVHLGHQRPVRRPEHAVVSLPHPLPAAQPGLGQERLLGGFRQRPERCSVW